MVMAYTITGQAVFGNKRVSWGTFTNGAGETGGDINTGLVTCEAMEFTISGAAVAADSPSVNETLPVAGTAVTIVTTAGADGYWRAFGY